MKYFEKVFYVNNGNKIKGDGSLESPFCSLEEAKKAVRDYKKKVGSFYCVHIIVYLRGGIYSVEDTLVFEKEDGGTECQQVTYQAYPGEKVIFDAGRQIDVSLFRQPSQEEKSRLKAGYEDKIKVLELTDPDIDRYFPVAENDSLIPDKISDYGFLAWNQYLLQLAQWPNHGYSHIKEVIDSGPSTRFLKKNEEPAPYSWEKPNGAIFTVYEPFDYKKAEIEIERTRDVSCYGFPDNDWYFQKEKIHDFKGEKVSFLRHTRYGVKDKLPLKRRIRFVNLLCELDEPGEWYYERSTKKLYLYPLYELNEQVNLRILGNCSPMILMEETENLEFKDLIFQNGGTIGIKIEGGKDNVIGGCTIRNISGLGFQVSGGEHNGITGCTMYGLDRAFYLQGGDKKNLKACNHYVSNTEIYECRNRGYELGFLDGFGMLISHNLIHDVNGGIMFSKCGEMIAEYNEFYRLGYEMGDWNPIYSGANCAAFGSILRFNFVHHMMELPEAYPLGGMRGDDNDAGNTYYGNVFYKSGRRGIDGHGPVTHAINNIIMDCEDGIGTVMMSPEKFREKNREFFADCYNDNFIERERKGDFWRQMIEATGDRFYFDSPTWSFRYPLLRMAMNCAPIGQTYSEVTLNYYNNCRRGFLYTHGGTREDYPETALIQDGVEISMDVFEDVESLNFNFKKDFRPMDGFYPIPFDEIGLKLDEYRYCVPNKKQYRSEVYQQYKGIPSCCGSYNMEKENEHYPYAAYQKVKGSEK